MSTSSVESNLDLLRGTTFCGFDRWQVWHFALCGASKGEVGILALTRNVNQHHLTGAKLTEQDLFGKFILDIALNRAT
jgi:hypothetical protein